MKNDLELSDFRYDVERLANEICMGENKKEMYFLVEGTNDRDVFVKFGKSPLARMAVPI